MYRTTKHLLACTASHCTSKGANDVLMLLRREVMKRGLDKEILVNNCGTIDLCDIGPNIVVYPDNVIYSGVTKADVPELVDALANNAVLERLVLNANTPAEAGKAENMMQSALKSIFAVAEAYPQLQANQNFLQLQGELVDTEDKIQASRRFYNGGVRELNTKIKVFPNTLFVRGLGFTEREFFEVDEPAAIAEPPRVQF